MEVGAGVADKETVVELPEEGVVTVEIDGDNQPPGKEAAVPAPKPRERKSKAAEDEAAALLSDAIKKTEEERESQRKRAEAAEASAAAERARTIEAQRIAEQRAEEARGYKEQAEQGEMAAVTAAIESASKRIQAAKVEQKRAYEAAEFDKVTDTNEEMANAAADLKMAQQRKADLESGALRKPTHEGRVEAPRIATDPFEQYVSQMTPRSQSFLRAHRECAPAAVGGDQTKNDKMMAGHYAAKAQGFPPDSDEYFRVIEETLGLRSPVVSASNPVSAAAETTHAGEESRPARRQPAPSAPPSREPPAASGQPARSTRSVVLTPQQQEAALISWPQQRGEEEQAWKRRAHAAYAYNLVQLESEGKLGRTSH
jgi:hypothetical protein